MGDLSTIFSPSAFFSPSISRASRAFPIAHENTVSFINLRLRHCTSKLCGRVLHCVNSKNEETLDDEELLDYEEYETDGDDIIEAIDEEEFEEEAKNVVGKYSRSLSRELKIEDEVGYTKKGGRRQGKNKITPTRNIPDHLLPRVAIVGRPNVGKSAMFNRLVGANKAIVVDIGL